MPKQISHLTQHLVMICGYQPRRSDKRIKSHSHCWFMTQLLISRGRGDGGGAGVRTSRRCCMFLRRPWDNSSHVYGDQENVFRAKTRSFPNPDQVDLVPKPNRAMSKVLSRHKREKHKEMSRFNNSVVFRSIRLGCLTQLCWAFS